MTSQDTWGAAVVHAAVAAAVEHAAWEAPEPAAVAAVDVAPDRDVAVPVSCDAHAVAAPGVGSVRWRL